MQRRSEITQTCNVIHELVYFNRIQCTNKKLIDFTHCILIETNNASYMYSSVIEQKPNSLNLNKRMYHLKKKPALSFRKPWKKNQVAMLCR